MKAFYAGIRFDHYDPRRQRSFEYTNFYLALKDIAGVEVLEFPLDRILEVGKQKFNEELLESVKREKPDVLFVFMYTDELEPAVLREIRETTNTKTIAWFADDYWRFWNYSRHWAPYFSYAVTTSPEAVDWYAKAGITNVIKSQWACSPEFLHPTPYTPHPTQDINVSFVGQYKPARAKIVGALRNKGIMVEAYGFGWPSFAKASTDAKALADKSEGKPGGKLSQEEMLNVISRSKINLNLNVRPSRLEPAVLARIFLKKSVNHLMPDFHFIDNVRAWWHFAVPHTHARPFELAGCKAFTISGYSEGIEKYYEPDKEMVFYKTIDDLAEKIRYYLSHDAERERIAQAGYERTVRDHTYEQRFRELLTKALHPTP
jgi:spore maturation protein CgeB